MLKRVFSLVMVCLLTLSLIPLDVFAQGDSNSRMENGLVAHWDFEGEMKDKEFFKEAMQEYCYSIFVLATPSARQAFFELSQHLCKLFPDRVDFLNNVGSYYLVTENYKSALKTYSKVLKKYPDDLTAIQNCVLAARRLKDTKLEIKYLQMMVKYAPEKDALAAKARIDALNRL